MEYVLKTNSLCKNYGHFKALNGLSMNVPKGSIYGLIGKNGAGKTTLIRLICGLQEPTSGDYVLYGKKHIDKDITKSRRRMGAIVETPSIYVDLTAYENLKEQYKVLGIPSDDGISEILKLVGLENTGNKKAKNFSLGMRQRLGIAVAYVLDTMNIEYKILSNTEADIFEKVNISKLTTELSKKDCEVISIHEHDESLESYFVSLVGGARHE